MTDEEIVQAINKVDGIGGMTVNERVYLSGLWDELEKAKLTDREKAKRILRWLRVDEASIDKIVI